MCVMDYITSAMDDVASCSFEIIGDERQNFTSNNIDHVPCAALQDMEAYTSDISQYKYMVTRGTCQLQNKYSYFIKD